MLDVATTTARTIRDDVEVMLFDELHNLRDRLGDALFGAAKNSRRDLERRALLVHRRKSP